MTRTSVGGTAGRLERSLHSLTEAYETRSSWIASRYPGHKFVVWAATLHNTRNLHELTFDEDAESPWEGLSLQDYYRDKRVMGDYLWEELGEDMYSLGFTAFEGAYRTGAPEPGQLEPPSAGSLEDLLASAGLDVAIVDFRSPAAGGECLREALMSRPLGYREMTATWNAVLDGMMFTRVMIPATLVEGDTQ